MRINITLFLGKYPKENNMKKMAGRERALAAINNHSAVHHSAKLKRKVMGALFKDIYSESFYDNFSEVLKQTIPAFEYIEFKRLIFNDQFAAYELKERMTHTAKVLNHFLPDNFAKATEIIKNIIKNLRITGIKETSIEFMFFPEYIAIYGIDDYETSVSAFELITTRKFYPGKHQLSIIINGQESTPKEFELKKQDKL
jgi:hypothetical protein